MLTEYSAGASAASLARKYQANIWSILSRVRAAGIPVRSNKEQNEKRLDLAPAKLAQLVEIIDGLMLGDGWIDRKGCLRLEQASRRKEWIDALEQQLASLGVSSRVIPIPPQTREIDGRSVSGRGGFLLYTPCYVEMQEQRQRWYPRGKKIVPLDLKMTPTVLTHWFCGDGSTNGAGALVFYTNGFKQEEVAFLVQCLARLGIESYVQPHQRRGEFTVFVGRHDEAVKIKNLIQHLVPECCQYKLRHVRPSKKRIGNTWS